MLTPMERPPSNRTRVKFYQLNAQGGWDDKGTGHIFCKWEDPQKRLHLVFSVRSETDNAMLLTNEVTHQEHYHKQQDTLIVWHTVEQKDLALSFLEKESCDEIWEHIMDVQQRLREIFGTSSEEPVPSSDGEMEFAQSDSLSEATEEPSSVTNISITPLPKPSVKTIHEIYLALQKINNYPFNSGKFHSMREGLIHAITKEGFVNDLITVLEECEDLEDWESLTVVADTMRSILFLADNNIYLHCISDELFIGVVGMLEYDKEYRDQKANYRDYLRNEVQFKQVIPIESEEMKIKIKTIFRLTFLRDVALARFLDDPNYGTLNSHIFFSQCEIVQYFTQNHSFLRQLFTVLHTPDDQVEPGKKEDGVGFLIELCGFAKQLQPSLKGAFFRSLTQDGLFSIFEHCLSHPSLKIRLGVASILFSVLEYDSALVRSICLSQIKRLDAASSAPTTPPPPPPPPPPQQQQQQHPQPQAQLEQRPQEQHPPQVTEPLTTPIIDVLIQQTLVETDLGLLSQLYDIIRSIIDKTSADEEMPGIVSAIATDTETDDFLFEFYSKYAGKLLKPLTELSETVFTKRKGVEVVDLTPDTSARCMMICDLLCFMIRCHTYQVKFVIQSMPLLKKCSWLLKASQPHLRLAALRFFRACVGMKDEYHNKYMIGKEPGKEPVKEPPVDVFGPIFVMFSEVKHRYNLLNSACLELFEFIRKEGIKTLMEHIVKNYRPYFEDVNYVSTFKDLVLRYEQSLLAPNEESSKDESGSTSIRMKPRPRDGYDRVDEDEEAYFNASDDDDLIPSSEDENKVTSSPTMLYQPEPSRVAPPPSLSLPVAARPPSPPSPTLGGSPNNSPTNALGGSRPKSPIRQIMFVSSVNSAPTVNASPDSSEPPTNALQEAPPNTSNTSPDATPKAKPIASSSNIFMPVSSSKSPVFPTINKSPTATTPSPTATSTSASSSTSSAPPPFVFGQTNFRKTSPSIGIFIKSSTLPGASPSPSSASTPLVDYPDDDEEEETTKTNGDNDSGSEKRGSKRQREDEMEIVEPDEGGPEVKESVKKVLEENRQNDDGGVKSMDVEMTHEAKKQRTA